MAITDSLLDHTRSFLSCVVYWQRWAASFSTVDVLANKQQSPLHMEEWRAIWTEQSLMGLFTRQSYGGGYFSHELRTHKFLDGLFLLFGYCI